MIYFIKASIKFILERYSIDFTKWINICCSSYWKYMLCWLINLFLLLFLMGIICREDISEITLTHVWAMMYTFPELGSLYLHLWFRFLQIILSETFLSNARIIFDPWKGFSNGRIVQKDVCKRILTIYSKSRDISRTSFKFITSVSFEPSKIEVFVICLIKTILDFFKSLNCF